MRLRRETFSPEQHKLDLLRFEVDNRRTPLVIGATIVVAGFFASSIAALLHLL